jgi:hypothetical protein
LSRNRISHHKIQEGIGKNMCQNARKWTTENTCKYVGQNTHNGEATRWVMNESINAIYSVLYVRSGLCDEYKQGSILYVANTSRLNFRRVEFWFGSTRSWPSRLELVPRTECMASGIPIYLSLFQQHDTVRPRPLLYLHFFRFTKPVREGQKRERVA